MEAILVPIFLFMCPVMIVAILQYFKFKTKQLEAHGRGNPLLLEAVQEEKKQLEARVQNLESIVCSVDLELNARLNRLAAQASAAGLLPAHGGAVAGSAPPANPHAATANQPAPFSPGGLYAGQKVANRYIIERELGHGGMGAVYLAKDLQLNERVALKVIASTVASDPAAAAERFRREVTAARKVTHPNVIRIYDLVEDGALLLLSMEFVEGMNLAVYLQRVGKLPVDEARHLVMQMCDGLGAAHAAGVVHRDLKPGNVLLDAEKRIRLIDFGLAKASFMQGMTATGLIIGTPEYMAPEQVRGMPCDARTDLYALGAVAYHMLLGKPPFAGETPIAVGFAHVTDPVPAPRGIRADLPAELDAALVRALQKDPAARFQDVAAFKLAFSTEGAKA